MEVDWHTIVKSKKTYITYRDKLEELGINELCMFSCLEKFWTNDDGIDNLCDVAYRKAQEDYFK